jgi:hypothetical protein
MAYAEAIPLDLLRSEQQRIADEQLTAERDQTGVETTDADIIRTYQKAVRLFQQGSKLYANAPDETRRQLNRAFLAQLRVDTDDEAVQLGSPWHEISETARYLRTNAVPVNAQSAAALSARQSTKNPGRTFADQGSNMFLLVVLIGQDSRLQKLHDLLDRQPSSTKTEPSAPPEPERQKQHHLTAAEVVTLARAYQTGATMRELAVKFNVHRSTVSGCLTRLGIPLRRRGLTPDQLKQAATLYQQGWSLSRVAQHLQCDAETIRQGLIRLGLTRRSPHERG